MSSREIIFGDVVQNSILGKTHVFTIGSGFCSFDFSLNSKLNLREDDPFLQKQENEYIRDYENKKLEINDDPSNEESINEIDFKMSIINCLMHMFKNIANGELNTYFVNKFTYNHNAELSQVVCKVL